MVDIYCIVQVTLNYILYSYNALIVYDCLTFHEDNAPSIIITILSPASKIAPCTQKALNCKEWMHTWITIEVIKLNNDWSHHLILDVITSHHTFLIMKMNKSLNSQYNMKSIVNIQSFAKYLYVLLKSYDLGLPRLPRWCSQLSPRSCPLQLKISGCTTTKKHRKSLKGGKNSVSHLWTSGLKEWLGSKFLGFSYCLPKPWDRALYNIQPGTASRHRKITPRKILVPLAKGLKPEKLFDNTHPTPAKYQQKTHPPPWQERIFKM